MKIFTFWEPSQKIPAYIRLCMATWKKVLPEAEIAVLDYSNINNFIEFDDYKAALCSEKFSLPQIADAIRCLVLEQHGGIWLDADTILLSKDVLKYFSSTASVSFFGNPTTKKVHIGFIRAVPHAKLLQIWKEECLVRIMSRESQKNSWDFLGNGIINSHLEHLESINIIDVTQANVTPEHRQGGTRKIDNYIDFYFLQNFHLKNIDCSMIMLHNSWTPDIFKSMSQDEFLKIDCTITNILSEILELDRSHPTPVSAYLKNHIAEEGGWLMVHIKKVFFHLLAHLPGVKAEKKFKARYDGYKNLIRTVQRLKKSSASV